MAPLAARREPLLSKSQYMRGLQCPKALWLYRNRKDLIPGLSPALQTIFDQGHEIGRLARERYPRARLIGGDHTQIGTALRLTRQAVKDRVRILFEPAALSDGVFARADMLTRDYGTWDLTEVKSATEVKPVYVHDAVVQRYVFEGAGFDIRQVNLLLVNKNYVRQGPIDPQKLFLLHDVTRETDRLLPDVKTHLWAMREVISSRSMPSAEVGDRCNQPYECAFKAFCWKAVPEDSIYDIPLSTLERAVLKERGIIHVRDIPENFKLLPMQRAWVETARKGEPHIDREAIADLLCQLRYPLYFLDFEAINPAIPPYDGLRPFQFLPFQASLHIREKAGDGLVFHTEFLGDGVNDPRPGLVDFLARNIGPRGSVVVFNSSFEGRCLLDLAVAFKRQRSKLFSIKDRLWDLAAPFRRGFYVHPEFKGGWSIKRVLPALVPGMTYDSLAIQNGTEAQGTYLGLMEGRFGSPERERKTSDLKEYCKLDTGAMVRLLDHLQDEASKK